MQAIRKRILNNIFKKEVDYGFDKNYYNLPLCAFFHIFREIYYIEKAD
jgi:hypothetical protein